MENDIVDIIGVKKEYTLGKVLVPALKGIDLTISAGEFLAISGPSGSGKTTLLNLIGCIESPTEGKILIMGDAIGEKTQDELADIRGNKIGFIFQQFNLIPVLTAFENVEYPLLEKKLSKKERREKVEHLLNLVGLSEFQRHRPLELSGGQRQRVAIARALSIDPLLILADEPTANLDHKTGSDILDLMKEANQAKGTTFVFSTHDPKVMSRASRIVQLEDGRIVNHQ